MRAHQRRHRARGAVMVESVVVITVLVAFLGLMVWTSHSYDEKLREQTATRAAVLHFGSNACQKKGVPAYPETARPGVSEVTGVRITDPTAEPGPAMSGVLLRMVGAIGNFLKGATGQRWGMAEAHASGRVNGSNVTDGRRVPLSRVVHGDSYVGCNEVVHDGKWEGLGGVIAGMSAAGGGLF